MVHDPGGLLYRVLGATVTAGLVIRSPSVTPAAFRNFLRRSMWSVTVRLAS